MDYSPRGIERLNAEKAAFERMKESDNLRPTTSIKEKIFRSFKNYF